MPVPSLQKVLTQVIKKGHAEKNNALPVAVFSLLAILCSSKFSDQNPDRTINPSYANKSGYKWQFLKSKNDIGDSTWFSIKLQKIDGTSFKELTTIEVNCNRFMVNNGQISFKAKNSMVKSQLTANSIGYFSVRTRPEIFKKNDSITIDFIMSEDDRPLINCE
tara:strand:- start:1285 stop:1773 length:489 start_codon:yes stop_codon:yes gene_type:complete